MPPAPCRCPRRAGRPGSGRADRHGAGPGAVPQLAGQADALDEVVEAVEEPIQVRVRGTDGRGEVVAEASGTALDRGEPSDEARRPLLEAAEVEVLGGPLGVVAAHELQRGLPARGHRVGHLVDGPGQAAGVLEPPEDVEAAVPPGHPGVAPDREGDVATGPVQLVGDLHAGRRRAHDEHAARPEPAGVAVVVRGHQVDPGGVEAGEACRHVRRPVRPGRDDDVARVPGAAAGDDAVAAGRAAAGGGGDFVHGGPVDHGRAERGGVRLEVADEGADAEVAVRVGPAVAPAGEPGHPARREQVQGVPALGAPAVADPAAVEHDVLASGVREQLAHREAGVAGPDDDGVDGGHPGSLQVAVNQVVTTSMWTGVGLVRAS